MGLRIFLIIAYLCPYGEIQINVCVVLNWRTHFLYIILSKGMQGQSVILQVRRKFFIDSDFSHNYLHTPYVFARLSQEQFSSTFAIFFIIYEYKE